MQTVLKGTRTKRKLADALWELLETTPLERVQVHPLTDRCGIHRQTFYCHFADVYELFTWSVREDGAAPAPSSSPSWRSGSGRAAARPRRVWRRCWSRWRTQRILAQ